MDLFPAVAVAVKATIKVMGWEMLVTGEDVVPRTGPAILATNHISYLDPILAGYGADLRGRRSRFLAKRELFDTPLFGQAMRAMRHIPVDRQQAPGRALKVATERLREGEVVVTFPEGTISTSLVPFEGKTGAARLAMAADVPLIPVALWGGQRIIMKHGPRQFRRGIPLAVRFGAPVEVERDEDPVVVTKRLMERITDLVDQAAATYPGQPSGDDDRWWLPRHLGGTAPTVEEAAEQRRREAEARRAARRQGRGRSTG